MGARRGRLETDKTRKTGNKKVKTNVGFHGSQRGIGTLRADVWDGAWQVGSGAGSHDECAGTGRTARGVLHEPEESNGADDGSEDDQSGVGACEGIGAVGDGGN